MQLISLRGILCLVVIGAGLALSPRAAGAAEFAAAIGRQGYGRCHMDTCSFFVIEASVPVGAARDGGTLYALAKKAWSAEYRPTASGDEYARPPKSTSKPQPDLGLVFCSKTRPTVFDFFDGRWHAASLRPGDDSAIFGANESAYQLYYAACHNFIVRSPYQKETARRLGYRFEAGQTAGSDDADERLQPLDLLGP